MKLFLIPNSYVKLFTWKCEYYLLSSTISITSKRFSPVLRFLCLQQMEWREREKKRRWCEKNYSFDLLGQSRGANLHVRTVKQNVSILPNFSHWHDWCVGQKRWLRKFYWCEFFWMSWSKNKNSLSHSSLDFISFQKYIVYVLFALDRVAWQRWKDFKTRIHVKNEEKSLYVSFFFTFFQLASRMRWECF